MLKQTLVPALVLALACSACQKREPATAAAPAAKRAQVDATRIVQADQDAGNWVTHGRTYSEQRYSPLTKIDAGNVRQLGLAWFLDLDTHRGQEATPRLTVSQHAFTPVSPGTFGSYCHRSLPLAASIAWTLLQALVE